MDCNFVEELFILPDHSLAKEEQLATKKIYKSSGFPLKSKLCWEQSMLLALATIRVMSYFSQSAPLQIGFQYYQQQEP